MCYALNTAQRLAVRPNVRMILLGGLFHTSAQTFSGEEALRTIEHLRINHAFLSAGGVHATHGVTCSNFSEVPIKQAAMKRALRRTLVVDATKIGQVRPAYFASIDQFDEWSRRRASRWRRDRTARARGRSPQAVRHGLGNLAPTTLCAPPREGA